ncbi:MAG: hypothetical protein UT57_C0036G0002 [Microgenomates group bacterium GW2011_GWC1_39_7]|nr:MAG: hypothetical protein UT57_C0036G0002 [Microgenomates group bacterium GW2011_GWC1_39_7]
MEYKKKIDISLIAFFVISTVSFYILNPVKNGLCGDTDIRCGTLLGDIGMSTFLFSVSLLVALLFLRWSKEPSFISWSRFAKYYLPIAALLIIFSPTTDSSIFGFDKEFMSWFLSSLFLVISIIIIFYKHFRQPK